MSTSRKSPSARFAALSCAAIAIAFGLGRDCFAQTIRFESASAVSAIANLASDEFRKGRKSAPAIVPGISGSSGALGRLCGGAIDIAGTERPIFGEEIVTCQKTQIEFVELPIALDAVVVVVNRRNSFVQDLTPSELRAMWQESAQGRIVRWSQINARFPDAPLKLIGPDRQYDRASIFTETILGKGQSPRRDTMASVDDGILIRGVVRDVNALAYVSYSTYLDHRDSLRNVPLVPDSSRAAGRSPGAGSDIQLSRPLFLYVNTKSLEKPFVRDFVEFTLLNGTQLAKEARYQPLPAASYKLALARLRSGVTGSAWDGSIPVGVLPSDVERRLASR